MYLLPFLSGVDLGAGWTFGCVWLEEEARLAAELLALLFANWRNGWGCCYDLAGWLSWQCPAIGLKSWSRSGLHHLALGLALGLGCAYAFNWITYSLLHPNEHTTRWMHALEWSAARLCSHCWLVFTTLISRLAAAVSAVIVVQP